MDDIKDYVANCYADMKMVNFLLEVIPDYEKVLVYRHHKFVDSYKKLNGNLSKISKSFGFSEVDIRRIFWRIQKKLLLEFVNRVDQGKIRGVRKVPSTFDSFLMWQLQQFREDAKEVYIYVKLKMSKSFNIDGVTPKKEEQIIKVLEKLCKRNDLDNILPAKVYPIAKDLLDGMTLTKVAEKHSKNFNYLVTTILGVKKPRNKAECGWLSYLENAAYDERKIIQFPIN